MMYAFDAVAGEFSSISFTRTERDDIQRMIDCQRCPVSTIRESYQPIFLTTFAKFLLRKTNVLIYDSN